MLCVWNDIYIIKINIAKTKFRYTELWIRFQGFLQPCATILFRLRRVCLVVLVIYYAEFWCCGRNWERGRRWLFPQPVIFSCWQPDIEIRTQFQRSALGYIRIFSLPYESNWGNRHRKMQIAFHLRKHLNIYNICI